MTNEQINYLITLVNSEIVDLLDISVNSNSTETDFNLYSKDIANLLNIKSYLLSLKKGE